MGKSYGVKYEIGHVYKIGNIMYRAVSESHGMVKLKPVGVSFTSPIGTKTPKGIITRKQQLRRVS